MGLNMGVMAYVTSRRLLSGALGAVVLVAAVPLAVVVVLGGVVLGAVVLGAVVLVVGILVVMAPLALAPLVVSLGNVVLAALAPFAMVLVGRKTTPGRPYARTGQDVTGMTGAPEELDISVPRLSPAYCPLADSNPCSGDCRICVKYRLYPGHPGRLVA